MRSSMVLVQAVCWGLAVGLAQDPMVSIVPRAPLKHLPVVTSERPTNLRVQSDLIVVPVLVTDYADRHVPGLDRGNFRLFEDEMEQQISHFSTEDVPISAALLFDSSSSMAKKLPQSRAAVREFLKASNPEDEFLLMEFNSRVRALTGFTSDADEVLGALQQVEPHGSTALLDAIYLAVNQLKHARHARKTILIISDGGDNYSRYSPREVLRLVQEADVQIWCIGIVDAWSRPLRTREEINGPSLLGEISAQTGGLYTVETASGQAEVARRIAMALRSQYVLGYSPSVPKRDGRNHRIVVKLNLPEGLPKLRASFRSSYLAPEP